MRTTPAFGDCPGSLPPPPSGVKIAPQALGPFGTTQRADIVPVQRPVQPVKRTQPSGVPLRPRALKVTLPS
jgi:hypothetical protein